MNLRATIVLKFLDYTYYIVLDYWYLLPKNEIKHAEGESLIIVIQYFKIVL